MTWLYLHIHFPPGERFQVNAVHDRDNTPIHIQVPGIEQRRTYQLFGNVPFVPGAYLDVPSDVPDVLSLFHYVMKWWSKLSDEDKPGCVVVTAEHRIGNVRSNLRTQISVWC